MTLVDVAGAGQLRATWADIDIALLVEDKIGATEGAIGARRLVPHRNVGCNLTIDQPLEQGDRAINGVARQSPGLQTKAAPDAFDHSPGDRNLHDAVGTGALGIEDDPSLVVDEVVCIVGEEWVHAWPGNPGRLWIGQRDCFGRLAATTAARTPIVSVAILLIAASGIESGEVLANCMGCLFHLRPGDRLVARSSLLLVHIRLDQACINRKCFSAHKPSCDAHCHHALKNTPQSIALSEAFGIFSLLIALLLLFVL